MKLSLKYYYASKNVKKQILKTTNYIVLLLYSTKSFRDYISKSVISIELAYTIFIFLLYPQIIFIISIINIYLKTIIK